VGSVWEVYTYVWRIVLKCILKEAGVMIWTRLSLLWLRYRYAPLNKLTSVFLSCMEHTRACAYKMKF